MEIIDGSNVDRNKLYKITDKPKDILAVTNELQKVSYILANMVGIFDTWFNDFFDEDYFKVKRIQSQANYGDFKSFMKDIYLKEKPILIINPEIELVEDSFYNESTSSMYNRIDSADEVGAKLLYCTDLISTENVNIYYRRNRYRIRFDLMMIERSLSRQIDLFNYLVMNLRHRSKFPISKNVLNLIPLSFMVYVANNNGYDYKSDDFMKFINTVSYAPIIKRIIPNGQYMFYMAQTINIDVSIPDMPSRDGIDNIGAIEKGARVVDRIEFEVNIPAEYILTIPQSKLINAFAKYDNAEDVYYIPPVKAHPDYQPLDNGFLLSNIIDIVIKNNRENSLSKNTILDNISTKYMEDIKEYLSNGLPIDDVMRVMVYESGTFAIMEIIDKDNKISIVDPDFSKAYSICVYINHGLLNSIREVDFKKDIGTIKDY